MLATTITGITAHCGTTFGRRIMQIAEAILPARIWPSPPRFQKRILNAGTTARETLSSMAMFWNSTQVRRGVEKDAS